MLKIGDKLYDAFSHVFILL